MSPTIFRSGGYRYYFFSREELRPHVHVEHADGGAKFWLNPAVELAVNHGLSTRQLTAVVAVIREHEDGIRQAWTRHFER